MAFVLVIGTLLLTAILSGASALRTNAGISATQTREEAVRNALVSFLARNNRLPCPARADLNNTQALYGREASTPGTCDNTIDIGGVANVGILPWFDLGLNDDSTLDAFNRRFTYAVMKTATDLDGVTVSGMQGNLDVHNTVPVAPANLINDGNPATVLIISHGTNGLGAWVPQTGTQIPPPAAGLVEGENTNNDLAFVRTDYADDPTDPFDDIVLWLTPNDLLAPLIKDGIIKSAPATLSERVEAIQDYILGSAMAGRIGTTPNISYPLPTTIPAGILATDPWGTPIDYAHIASIEATTPLGTDDAYSLQSNGPNTTDDGGALDDILFTVTVDELRGIFTKTGF